MKDLESKVQKYLNKGIDWDTFKNKFPESAVLIEIAMKDIAIDYWSRYKNRKNEQSSSSLRG